MLSVDLNNSILILGVKVIEKFQEQAPILVPPLPPSAYLSHKVGDNSMRYDCMGNHAMDMDIEDSKKFVEKDCRRVSMGCVGLK